jgi:hypothetical protein
MVKPKTVPSKFVIDTASIIKKLSATYPPDQKLRCVFSISVSMEPILPTEDLGGFDVEARASKMKKEMKVE